jgi:hypothetical protein
MDIHLVHESSSERFIQNINNRFRSDDKEAYDDLLNQCEIYASYASATASPVKEKEPLADVEGLERELAQHALFFLSHSRV